MVLEIPGGLFGSGGIFKPSPTDFDVMTLQGDRYVPVNLLTVPLKYPKTITTEVSAGGTDWTNPNNVKSTDSTYATNTVTLRKEDVIQLILNGSRIGENKSKNTVVEFNVDTWRTYGGELDLWDYALTPQILNNKNFGISIMYEVSGGGVGTYYLNATNFVFSIPQEAEIIGLKANIMAKYSFTKLEVDAVRLKVYYTL